MTEARRAVVDPNERGYYHCRSRCVRRAFLCGFDKATGRSFEHRREWLRRRLAYLIDVFAIECAAFDILSNHLHLLLHTRPDRAEEWSAQEVARRWLKLFRTQERRRCSVEPTEEELAEIVNEPELVEKYRTRLSSLSWFHSCLKQHIAARANAEDECTGRFWDGRFGAKRVADLAGLLACMIYIDLNEIRAGQAPTPEESRYASVRARLRAVQGLRTEGGPRLIGVSELFAMSEEAYISLVDETGRAVREGKRSIPSHYAPILTRVGIAAARWVVTTQQYETDFFRVVGSSNALITAAKDMGKRWLHGISAARLAFS